MNRFALYPLKNNRSFNWLPISIVLLLMFSAAAEAQKVYTYPIAHKDTAFDVYFNKTIEDPYRWMEDPDSPELADWLAKQKKLTKTEQHKHFYVSELEKQFLTIYSKTKKKSLYKESNKNTKNKKYLFKYEYNSSKRTPDLMYKKIGHDNYKTLVNSKRFKSCLDDNPIIKGYKVNDENTFVAVNISHSGSDWMETYIFNLETGDRLPDTLNYLRFNSNLIWAGDGIYYDRYNKPKPGRALLDKAKGQRFCYHKLNNPQSNDKVLYYNPDTTGSYSFYCFRSNDRFFFYHYYKYKGRWLKALSVSDINPDYFFLRNFLIYPNSDTVKLSISEIRGDSVFIKTSWGAPNGKVLLANVNKLNQLSGFIPEYDIVLERFNFLGKDKYVGLYRDNGRNIALIFDQNGKLLKKLSFPVGRSIKHLYENDTSATFTRFSVTSFYVPEQWYRLSLKDLQTTPYESISVPYNFKALETRYVEYTSKDGTKIPMYITCFKETKLDGNNPVILYGYGGYGITVEPFYNSAIITWLVNGGILAVPNIRGGGAGGSKWELAGKRLNKQKGIDDFIAAAEFLIDKKYTNPEKLAVMGGSHGGLLTGAAITQKPELFKAAIAEAGVFDMIRFGKYTVGSAAVNQSEFGNVSDSANFFNLLSYSPLHNIKAGVKYPNLLLITGDHDDRVPPFHSYKFLATMQEKGDPHSLYLLYLVKNTGHGGALTPDEYINKVLFEYYFLFDKLGLSLRRRKSIF